MRLSLNHPVRLFVDSNTDVAGKLRQEFVRIKAKKEGDREALVTGKYQGKEGWEERISWKGRGEEGKWEGQKRGREGRGKGGKGEERRRKGGKDEERRRREGWEQRTRQRVQREGERSGEGERWGERARKQKNERGRESYISIVIFV